MILSLRIIEVDAFDVMMRIATSNDRKIVTDILTQAFDDNKSVNFVVKQDHLRVKRIRNLMEYSFNLCLTFGEVWITDDNQACALILFPDRQKTSFQTILWNAKLALSSIGLERVGRVLKREKAIKTHHPKEPICYLWFIGVTKNSQGKGLGTELMKRVLLKCAEKKRPVYLETSTESNLPFYTKFGFKIFHSIDLSYKLNLLRKNSSAET